MLIGLIPYIRKDMVEHAVMSLSDCDAVYTHYGEYGEIEARNRLLELVPSDSVVRFCDDDDAAANTRTMFDFLGDASVVVASYRINNARIVTVPRNALAIATNYVAPWNWVAKIKDLYKIRDRFGSFFDPSWVCNTGTRFWLRMIDVGLKFRVMPDVVCYNWNRGTVNSKSSLPKNDKSLYAELLRRGAPKNLVKDRIRFDNSDTTLNTM